MNTEEQASKKWCPHAVASHTDPRQTVDDTFLHKCIASECMAWRVGHTAFMVTLDGKPEEEWRWDPRTSNAAYYKDVQVREVVYGFCGLAGK